MLKKDPIIIGNWKMHKTRIEVKDFFEQLQSYLPFSQKKVLIAPAFPSLAEACALGQSMGIMIGAQNMHEKDKGAFTGEVSASMIQEVGAEFVLIGHSERRHFYHETDQMIAQKILQALSHGLLPILCIGETLQEREEKKTLSILTNQLKTALPKDPCEIIIAYEPVWAIGTGQIPDPQTIEAVHQSLRELLASLWGKKQAEDIAILYGGSVTSKEVQGLAYQPNIDGVLIGSASLEVTQFIQIIKGFSK